jgi:thiosulfate dehydrogenase
MIRTPVPVIVFTAGALVATAALAIMPRLLQAQSSPLRHQIPPASNGATVVMLCDGKTSLAVKGLTPGHPMSHEQALAVTRTLMAKWQARHPGEQWQMAQAASGTAPGARRTVTEQVQGVPVGRPPSVQQADTYASFTARDYKIWQAETDKFVAYGKEVFHSDKLLGSTIGVSCDMCHPDAANTHPETYPKYQVQLQRVALLRDMIDWCIENPVKGKTLSPDDPKLRALEAYILAQRKGVPLAYGKH